MKDCLEDFKGRVEEIEKYFALVVSIDKIETYKFHSISMPNGDSCLVDSDLQKILKASCYLMLYNIIESSIRNAVIAIYDAIHDDGLTYNDLAENIQKVWLDYQSESLEKANKKTIVNKVKQILNSVSDNSVSILEKDKLPISGNLNAEKINSLINQYGFFGKISVDRKRAEYVFDHVVKMRCDLAHGNVSFRQASSLKVTSEIITIKDDVIKYLEDLLNNVSTYITDKKYKR